MCRFRRKLVSFILLDKCTLALTNPLAYYEIRTVSIRSVFILQVQGQYVIKLFTDVIKKNS